MASKTPEIRTNAKSLESKPFFNFSDPFIKKYKITQKDDIALAKTKVHMPFDSSDNPAMDKKVPINKPEKIAKVKPLPLTINLLPLEEVSILTRKTENIAKSIPNHVIQLNFYPNNIPEIIGIKVDAAAVTGLITPIGPIARATYKNPIARIPTTPLIIPK